MTALRKRGRPTTGRTKEPTNLSLNTKIKEKAVNAAEELGESLTQFIQTAILERLKQISKP